MMPRLSILIVTTILFGGLLLGALFIVLGKNQTISELNANLFNTQVLLSAQNQNISSSILEEKRRCADAGKAKFAQDVKDLSGGPAVFSPQYVYNEKLTTCLYLGEYQYSDGGDYRFILDLYTNQNLITYLKAKSNQAGIGTVEEFEAARRLYFDE